MAIVSGSYGAGHDAVAREVEERLRLLGCPITQYDVAELLPGRSGRLLKRAYYAQLRTVPATWGATLSLSEPGRPLHRAAIGAFGLGAPRVSRAVAGADLVIATHPFAALTLGRARDAGLLSAPVVTYLTDASVHSMWVHRGVDLHLAIHEVAARQARHWGGRTVTISPVVPTQPPTRPSTSGDPLAGIGVIGPRALVTGGSLGIGDLARTARDIAGTGVMSPVVACGTNAGLARRLQRAGIAALSWRHDMPEVIDACQCVVQNAGGFTCLEALSSGTPVLTYLPIPGHGITNAAGLEQAGLVPWPRTPEDLRSALELALLVGGTPLVSEAPSVVDVLTRPDWRALAEPISDTAVQPESTSHESVA